MVELATGKALNKGKGCKHGGTSKTRLCSGEGYDYAQNADMYAKYVSAFIAIMSMLAQDFRITGRNFMWIHFS